MSLNKNKFKPLMDNFLVEEPEEDEGKSVHGSKLSEKLTNVTSRPNEKDAYGNSMLTRGNEDDVLSDHDLLDPAGLENPNGGSFSETGPLYCYTCKASVSAEEFAAPTHLGHNVCYGEEKKNFDINPAARHTLDTYEIGPDVVGNESAWAPKPNENYVNLVKDDVAATPNLVLDQVDDRTVPL